MLTFRTMCISTQSMHIYERHQIIARHFMDLGVDEKTAKEDASRIERFISDSTFNAVKASVNKA